MLDGDVADQLQHGHGLADARAAEQAHLAAAGEGAHQVDHLDAGLEEFVAALLVLVGRRLAVDGQDLPGVDRALLVDRVTEHVHDPSEGLLANGNRDRFARVGDGEPARQALRRAHGDAAHDAVAQLLLGLERQARFGDDQRIEDAGHFLPVELDIDDCADDLDDPSVCHAISSTLF